MSTCMLSFFHSSNISLATLLNAWPPAAADCSWPTLEEGKEPKLGENYKPGGLSGPGRPLRSDDSAALQQVREARQRLRPWHVSLFSLVSRYTMYKEHSKTSAASVSASQARVCAKVVEHCLDQLWQVIVVLPAPVLPRVGVIEVHWPTVSWGKKKVN